MSQPSVATSAAPTRAAARGVKKEKPRSRYAEPRRFSNGIYKVVKQEAPGLAISSSAMATLESLVATLAQGLVEETARVAAYNKHGILSVRDAKYATQLFLSECGELGTHALHSGVRASVAYAQSRAASLAAAASD